MPVVLEELHEERDGIVGLYLHGGCIAFARAAQERTGWPAVSVDTASGTFAHVGLRAPDGSVFDSRGFISEAEFASSWKGPAKLADLDELETLYPCSEFQKDMAQRHLSMLFPDFPGKMPMEERLDAFATALQGLCKEHGFHLRPGSLHGMVLYPSYGDESGYEVRIHAGSITMERKLGEPADEIGFSP